MPNADESGLLARLRGVAREIRYAPDRLLHARRRAEAHRRIESASSFDSVVFICYGNVCRSPYAKFAFERLVAGGVCRGVAATSAGFIGPDRQSPENALAAARRRGLDMTEHRSQLITADTIESNRLFVVVSQEQAEKLVQNFGAPAASILVLGDLDPLPVDRRTIPDPWGGDDAAFDASYDRITRCVEELVQILARARS